MVIDCLGTRKGKRITRKEARKIALDILHRAEEERRRAIEEEAERDFWDEEYENGENICDY